VYAKYRPDYPDEFIEEIVSAAPSRELAWDVGTGNGQAAVSLAKHFIRVVGTDRSAGQIAHAMPRDNITYKVTEPNMAWVEIEKTVGPAGSVDLITVAQALHWFEFDDFFAVVRKALRRPGGVFAAWTYTPPQVNAEIDAVGAAFYKLTVPYWDCARKYIEDGYETIPFPFGPVRGRTSTGPFTFETSKLWTYEDMIGYYKTWSPYNTAKEKGIDLLAPVEDDFKAAWGDLQVQRKVTWPLLLRIGVVREEAA